MAVAVGKIGFLSADYRFFISKVFGAHPVERDIGKRRLTSPAARRVNPVDKALQTLLYALFVHLVGFYKGREVGVEGAERLRSRPFILHNTKKVYYLLNKGGKVARRLRRNLVGNAAQTLLDELPERPARAIARKHRKVMDVEGGCLMRFGDCRCVDIFKPVVRRYRTGVMQDETAERKVDIGILVHPPIAFTQIAVHRFVNIDHQPLRIADCFPFCTVENKGFCNTRLIAFNQNIFDDILNFLDCGNRMRMP